VLTTLLSRGRRVTPLPSEPRSSHDQATDTPGRLAICLISEEFPRTGLGRHRHLHAPTSPKDSYSKACVHVVARTWEPESLRDIDGGDGHRLAVPEPCWRRGTYTLNLRFAETRSIWAWSSRVASCITRSWPRAARCHRKPEYRAQAIRLTMMNPRLPLVVKLHTPHTCAGDHGSGPPAAGSIHG